MPSTPPLVSVICLCYNQARFVEEAIQSVLQQTYPQVELIVVDDGSSDSSREVIEKILTPYRNVKFIALEANIGNCRAFNRGWQESKGEFVIDLAADDVLMPGRIEKGIEAFAKCDSSYGVNFSNAELIDEDGSFLRHHYTINQHGQAKTGVPHGDLFKALIRRYFICAPTMMCRREVLDHLEGYDENLSYEDFDFWVRSSRVFKYIYSDQVLVKKRVVKGSKGQRQFEIGSRDFLSTYRVCAKAKDLVENEEERSALKHRIYYELKQAARFLDFKTLLLYLKLLRKP